MLSHYNVLANIEAMAQVFWIGPSDRIVGVLPFFHSFGYTVTIWFPLHRRLRRGLSPQPGRCQSRRRTHPEIPRHVSCSPRRPSAPPTPASARAEEFASLRFVLVGAEKLREPWRAAFREKFGVDLLEGYGCTEMAPVVAVNAPNFEAGKRYPDRQQAGHRGPSAAGRGRADRRSAPRSRRSRPIPRACCWSRAPTACWATWASPRAPPKSSADDWYVTGDIARIDDEGFLRITDRLSRFSKIAGEMVPHMRIEDAIAETIGDIPCAVTAVADDQRGERLVAMYVSPNLTPADLWQKLAATDLPRLWLPKRENIYRVENLPALGTGKLDLRGVKTLAQQLTTTEVA